MRYIICVAFPAKLPAYAAQQHESWKELVQVFISVLEKKHIYLYLVFIFLYRLGEGLAMKIAPIFLKDGIA